MYIYNELLIIYKLFLRDFDSPTISIAGVFYYICGLLLGLGKLTR